jgi:hypothetical protein
VGPGPSTRRVDSAEAAEITKGLETRGSEARWFLRFGKTPGSIRQEVYPSGSAGNFFEVAKANSLFVIVKTDIEAGLGNIYEFVL